MWFLNGDWNIPELINLSVTCFILSFKTTFCQEKKERYKNGRNRNILLKKRQVTLKIFETNSLSAKFSHLVIFNELGLSSYNGFI